MLTAWQQQLVTNNHNLIYGYAHSHGLDLNEYYDLLGIALCEAVKIHDPVKGSLSTIAYLKMRQAVEKHNRKKYHKFYYEPYTYNIEQGYEDVEMQDLIEYTKKFLTDKQLKVFELYLDGYSQSEIARTTGCSRQNISQLIQKCIAIMKGEMCE